jgi:hypothetical protein
MPADFPHTLGALLVSAAWRRSAGILGGPNGRCQRQRGVSEEGNKFSVDGEDKLEKSIILGKNWDHMA